MDSVEAGVEVSFVLSKESLDGDNNPLPCCSRSAGSSGLEATLTSALCISRLVLPIFVMTCPEDLPAYDVAKVPLSGMDCVGDLVLLCVSVELEKVSAWQERQECYCDVQNFRI
jgi:hypothetical protein